MNLVELAQRIRQLRQERQLTVDETARRAGLTRSWLSKVESFRLTPSLPALGKLAEALGVTVADLVKDLDARPQIVRTGPDERMVVERDADLSNIVYESLAFKRADRRMDPMLLTVPPEGGRTQALPHAGEEFLLVLEGRVNFEYNSEIMELKPGDALYFDGQADHRLFNPHKKPARVLCVYFGLDNGRAH